MSGDKDFRKVGGSENRLAIIQQSIIAGTRNQKSKFINFLDQQLILQSYISPATQLLKAIYFGQTFGLIIIRLKDQFLSVNT